MADGTPSADEGAVEAVVAAAPPPAGVVGIDFDTFAVHWAVVGLESRDLLDYGSLRYRTAKQEAWQGLPELAAELPRYAHRWRTGVAYVERGFGMSRKVDWALGRAQGAIFAILAACDVPANEITLQAWRSAVMRDSGQKVNAKKDVVHARLRALGYDLPTPDLFDALGIALAGQLLNHRLVGRGS